MKKKVGAFFFAIFATLVVFNGSIIVPEGLRKWVGEKDCNKNILMI